MRSLNKMSLPTVLALIVGVIAVAYVGACTYASDAMNEAFDLIRIGDTEAIVIARFRTAPSVREKSDAIFLRYATSPCTRPCVERLWYENRLSLDVEAWSVELDQYGRVIRKVHWISP